MTKVFVEPENLADYHQQIIGDKSMSMHIVAEDDEYESSVWIGDDDGMPVLMAMLHGVEVETLDYFEDSDDLEGKAARMYAVYVGSTNPNYKIATVETEDELEDDDQYIEDDNDYSDEDLKEMFGRDDSENEIIENEEEYTMLLEQVFEFLTDGDELVKAISSKKYAPFLEEVKDDICYALADLGLSVRRPMVMHNTDGGSYIEEYPYN